MVTSAIRRLCKDRGLQRLSLDAVKVAHHGSKHNTNKELLESLESPSYLISTNGDQFKHPDKECLARIIKFGKPRQIYFNYESKYTKPWLDKAAQTKYHYTAIVRERTALSLQVALP